MRRAFRAFSRVVVSNSLVSRGSAHIRIITRSGQFREVACISIPRVNCSFLVSLGALSDGPSACVGNPAVMKNIKRELEDRAGRLVSRGPTRVGDPAYMRGDDDAGSRPERVVAGQRFRVRHVERGPDPSPGRMADQGIGIRNCTARHVDQQPAVGHGGKEGVIDQVPGGVAVRNRRPPQCRGPEGVRAARRCRGQARPRPHGPGWPPV